MAEQTENSKNGTSAFLDAEWRKLLMFNYAVDETLLLPYLPYKTEIDRWNGVCYASLVGFMFLNTKMMGLKIPFHVNFEEVNLRFYVRYREGDVWKRGVVFIKEIVPRLAISVVANTLYGEHYETLPMRHQWTETVDALTVEYAWKKGGWHSMKATAENRLVAIEAGSESEFITEHYWGYSQIGTAKTSEYGVEHPKWDVYPVRESSIDVDFETLYGPSFKFLGEAKPLSVFIAEGSSIKVNSKRIISE
jgi:uncharacterized protein YqjF (DUF2071 family)